MILIKAGSIIKITEAENYEKANLCIYQWRIGNLIYLVCETRPNISFAGR